MQVYGIPACSLFCSFPRSPGNATSYMDRCNTLWPCLRGGWDSPLAGCADAQLRAVQQFSTDFLARLAMARVPGKAKDG